MENDMPFIAALPHFPKAAKQPQPKGFTQVPEAFWTPVGVSAQELQ